MSVLCYLHIPPFAGILKETAHLKPNALFNIYRLVLNLIILRKRYFKGLFNNQRGSVGLFCSLPEGTPSPELMGAQVRAEREGAGWEAALAPRSGSPQVGGAATSGAAGSSLRPCIPLPGPPPHNKLFSHICWVP